MSFLGILTSNQSTMTRIALHKKVCCWDTGSVLHFPVPVYPPQTRQLYWRGAGKGAGQGVEVTRADTMCLSDPVAGWGRLLPAAALLATPAPTLGRNTRPGPSSSRGPDTVIVWACTSTSDPAAAADTRTTLLLSERREGSCFHTSGQSSPGCF